MSWIVLYRNTILMYGIFVRCLSGKVHTTLTSFCGSIVNVEFL